MEHVQTHAAEWRASLAAACPENHLPMLGAASPVMQALRNLLLIRILRRDRVAAACTAYVAAALGEHALRSADDAPDLRRVVTAEVGSQTPVLLCCVPGFDASARVDDLVAAEGRRCTTIAIGSAEGFVLADKSITQAARTGDWVLLQNVHLAPQWLATLEKRLRTLQPHANFRLFMAMEISPSVPPSLLRASRKFIFELPPGVRANMLRTYASVGLPRMNRAPVERARVYWLLAWFHALMQERVRYVPLGWTKSYDFNESDLRGACDAFDAWLDAAARGRGNLPPEEIPWPALRTILASTIYGGRVDGDFDQRVLGSLLSRLFSVHAFDPAFDPAGRPHTGDGDAHGADLCAPDAIRAEQFRAWADALPDTQSPQWLGLPADAEKVLHAARSHRVVSQWLLVQSLEAEADELDGEDADDNDDVGAADGREQDSDRARDGGLRRHSDGDRPHWMRVLQTLCQSWLGLLSDLSLPAPASADAAGSAAESTRDPLARCFAREIASGAALLATVQNDLVQIVEVCEGRRRQTNHLRDTMSALNRGVVPHAWRRYTVPPSLTVAQWLADFARRVRQLATLARLQSASEFRAAEVWLAGLFAPEAYITATRQCIARTHGWSLESLQLKLVLGDAAAGQRSAQAFVVRGLQLCGAVCDRGTLRLTNAATTELPLSQLLWTHGPHGADADATATPYVTLPLYLNSTRSSLLLAVDLAIAPGELAEQYYERGVALLCSAQEGAV